MKNTIVIKSGVNISLANSLVKHISKITKKDVKKTNNPFERYYRRFWIFIDM